MNSGRLFNEGVIVMVHRAGNDAEDGARYRFFNGGFVFF